VDYYKKKYKNTIFIVASNGMEWTKKNMPRHIVVKYVAGSTEMDMATIVECDHVIMTIGSYGWWCGWLAGGDVVYYKRAAIPGSRFAKRINYEDHFYPGWVGF
jgi:galactoside 2-L-fucosyltransferase 1/2